jgi:hypothetical protein
MNTSENFQNLKKISSGVISVLPKLRGGVSDVVLVQLDLIQFLVFGTHSANED